MPIGLKNTSYVLRFFLFIINEILIINKKYLVLKLNI